MGMRYVRDDIAYYPGTNNYEGAEVYQTGNGLVAVVEGCTMHRLKFNLDLRRLELLEQVR